MRRHSPAERCAIHSKSGKGERGRQGEGTAGVPGIRVWQSRKAGVCACKVRVRRAHLNTDLCREPRLELGQHEALGGRIEGEVGEVDGAIAQRGRVQAVRTGRKARDAAAVEVDDQGAPRGNQGVEPKVKLASVEQVRA